MTTLPTAEWYIDTARFWDGRIGLQRSAGQFRAADQDVKIAAALRIAARVLDDQTQAKLEEIIMGAPALDGNDFTDEREAARSILAYLKGEE